MTKGRERGYKCSEETIAKMKESQRLWRERRKAKELRDTACSLCFEYARPEDYPFLHPLCQDRASCKIRKLFFRFLQDFRRIN
ncbi:MAG TPA: hypothetical protein VMW92_02085 [Candidatus Heimdallarchaeota archaeon]|nr:hypothetical protein [Candidatus Heimdallarchaeota archaeon]